MSFYRALSLLGQLDLRARVPVLWGTFVALQSLLLTPLWMDAILQAVNVNAGFAGALVGVELGVLALLAGAVAVRVDRIDRRLVGAAGLLIILLANIFSAIAVSAASAPALLIARMFAGLGEGMFFAILAVLASPGRIRRDLQPLAHGAFVVVVALAFLLSPIFFDTFGAVGLYGWMTANAAFGCVLIANMSRQTLGGSAAWKAAGSSLPIPLIVGQVLSAAAFAGAWAYLCLFALRHLGFQAADMAWLLACGALLSFFARPAARHFMIHLDALTGAAISLIVFLAGLSFVGILGGAGSLFAVWILITPFMFVCHLDFLRRACAEHRTNPVEPLLPVFCYFFVGAALGAVTMAALWPASAALDRLIGLTFAWGSMATALFLIRAWFPQRLQSLSQ